MTIANKAPNFKDFQVLKYQKLASYIKVSKFALVSELVKTHEINGIIDICIIDTLNGSRVRLKINYVVIPTLRCKNNYWTGFDPGN